MKPVVELHSKARRTPGEPVRSGKVILKGPVPGVRTEKGTVYAVEGGMMAHSVATLSGFPFPLCPSLRSKCRCTMYQLPPKPSEGHFTPCLGSVEDWHCGSLAKVQAKMLAKCGV